jgi:hypothetical protein
MKKAVFTAILITTIVISGLIGYADQNGGTAEKQTELGTVLFSFNK